MQFKTKPYVVNTVLVEKNTVSFKQLVSLQVDILVLAFQLKVRDATCVFITLKH